jgi:hypothetical protein
MRLLLWLYPRRWRRRYLGEMEAVLEHEPWSLAVCFDLLRGALDAHLVLRRGRGQHASVPGRVWAALALAGGLSLVLATGRLAGARVGIPVGVVLGLVAADAMFRRLGRPPRGRHGDDGDADPPQGAPVPRKPPPSGPSRAAGMVRAIRGRRRPAATEQVHEEVEPEYQETIRQRFST